MKKTLRTHTLGISLAVGLLAFLASCSVLIPRDPAIQKNFIWELRSEKSVVFLFGSFPVKTPGFYPLRGIIEDSFEESDTLVVQTDHYNSTPAKIWAALSNGGVYHRHDSLSGHLTEETQNLLIPRLESLNFSFEGMDRFKPWYVGLKIREKVLKNRGYLPENGMDYYFLEKAGEKKRVRELERVKEKVAFLNSLSMSEQEAYLLATFWELELRKKSSAEIFAAWSWGDEESMDAIFSRAAREQGNGGDFYREVLHRRNQRFAEKIEGFLEGEGSYFVVVDASHLAGEKGIVNLLVEKGFTAQQL